jgi:hypothetical protein
MPIEIASDNNAGTNYGSRATDVNEDSHPVPHKTGKLVVSLRKTADAGIEFSVLHQHDDLYVYGVSFTHLNVAILVNNQPDLYFDKHTGRVSLFLRGATELRKTHSKLAHFDTLEQRDSVFDQIIEALQAFADNNYFGPVGLPVPEDTVYTF